MAVRNRKQAARSSRKRLSYKESSSDDDRPSKGAHRSELFSRRKVSVASSKAHGTKPRVQEYKSHLSIPSDGIVPAWESLPFNILLAIFQYASYPLRNETLSPMPTISWLVNAARTCKAFRDPALVSLYENPPLFHLHQPHNLLSLLVRDPATWAMNYKAAIKTLELNAVDTLAYTLPGRGLMDLGALIRQLPQLKGVNITDAIGRLSYAGTKWHYPASLFDALEESEIQLRSWRWNAYLMPRKTLLNLERLHDSLTFAGVVDLTLSHLVLRRTDSDLPTRLSYDVISMTALQPLKWLRSLILESCHSSDWKCLRELPAKLNKLVIKKTEDLDSQAISSYLQNEGSDLIVLELSHNRALDLSFLPKLSESCPKLDSFAMDLTFFRDNYNDSEALFDSLMGPDDIPSWPNSLRKIEICHLRKWSSGAAETFFGSLIDSARNLPYLRILLIKASINIGWRDRAGFREKWISRLQFVFKSRCTPPTSHLRSLKAFRLYKIAEVDDRQQTSRSVEKSKRSSGSQVQPLSSTRRSQRNKANEMHAEIALPVKSADIGAECRIIPLNRKYGISELDVQGLCETVDIAIDNQRPVEQKWNNEDFMDLERSGDEDYVD